MSSASPARSSGQAFHAQPNTLCGAHTVEAAERAEGGQPVGAQDSAWYVVPEQLSIYGTELYDELSPPDKHRLSRFEAALWASNTVHGEDQVLGGLAPRGDLHYFVGVFAAEEVNHQQMFRSYLQHLGVELLPTRAVGWMTPPLTEAEFFACTYVF
ncbi:MAG TPA: diiron oxygenase, partial [Marmoricola sp.]|nr:diiron oxygenase [Marmoricola sp.]